MLKIFCDNCGSDNAATTSRRIEHLVKDDGKDLGIEIILLHHDASSPDHHLCTDCFASFLIAAAKTFVGTATMAKHEKFLSQAIDYDLAVSRLNEKEEALAARDADLAKKAKALMVTEKELNDKVAESVDQARSLMIQLAEAKLAAKNALIQADATRKERPIMKHVAIEGEDPAYIEAVRKREAIRASGRR